MSQGPNGANVDLIGIIPAEWEQLTKVKDKLIADAYVLNESLAAEKRSLERYAQRLADDGDSLRRDMDGLRADLRTSREDNKVLKGDNATLNEKNKALQERIKQLEAATIATGSTSAVTAKNEWAATVTLRSTQAHKRERSPSIELIENPNSCQIVKAEGTPPTAVTKLLDNTVSLSSLHVLPTPSTSHWVTHDNWEPERKRARLDSFSPLASVSSETPEAPYVYRRVHMATPPPSNPSSSNESVSKHTRNSPNEQAEAPFCLKPNADGASGEAEADSATPRHSLPSSITSAALNAIPALAIDPPPNAAPVSRVFLRQVYGGSQQALIQKVIESRNPSERKLRMLAFPHPDMNPAMPSAPGQPGLLYASRPEFLQESPWTMFRRWENEKKKLVWLYLGEYETAAGGRMSGEWFREQSAKFQDTWAQFLMNSSRETYMAVRARIALRQSGLIPTDDEADQALVAAEVIKIAARPSKKNKRKWEDANKDLHTVTKSDIIEAFSRGDEGISVVEMKCVKYDHVFANDMSTRLPDAPALMAEDRRAKLGQSTTKHKNSKAKRKPDSNDMETDGEPDSREENEEEESDAPHEPDGEQEECPALSYPGPVFRFGRPPPAGVTTTLVDDPHRPEGTETGPCTLSSSPSYSSIVRRIHSVWDPERGIRVQVLSQSSRTLPEGDIDAGEHQDCPSDAESTTLSMRSFYCD
ncbi:hypothetical protein FA15DRAFT_672877 [Coprinopsis marcescibilis]|uniref:DUF6697 domain-containing protein n=1 Tax=Coprinopsis marcescibilis TaxID=230819 RepID=A0A5C3KM63_COPMA|nr:hypothetical protein FA15DRAFT_672877 [Coprinopsis marcescibilis]